MKKIRLDTKVFGGLAALSWLVIVFIGYLYIHRAFSASELLGVLLVIWRTVVAVGILSLAGGIGMLTSIRKWDVPPLAQAVLTCTFGLGVLGIAVLIFASTIGANFSLWTISLVAGIFLRKQIMAWWHFWRAQNHFWRNANSFRLIVFLLTALILGSQLLEALAPPLQFDALTYHLTLPAFYLQAGRIVYSPENIFWGMPQQTEMIYMLSMSLGGLEAATVLGWCVGVLTLIGLADFVKSIYVSHTAEVAIAVLLAGSGFTSSLSSGYVEWMSILLGLCILISLNQWLKDGKISTVGLTGAFAGMALNIKYTNGIIFIASFLVILIFHKRDPLKVLLFSLLGFGSVAILIMLPWMIKNFLAVANPFYPLFVPSGGMDAILRNFYEFKPVSQDWTRLVLLPWQSTVLGIDGGEGFSSSIGPLLLGLAPLAWMYWHEHSQDQKSAVNLSGALLAIGFIFWAIGSQFRGLLIQTRLYFILFPAYTLLAAAGFLSISRIKAYNIRFGNLAKTVIVLALAFNTFANLTAISVSNPIPVILNNEERIDYTRRHLGSYADAMQIVKSLPNDTKVLMLWETRSIECFPKCDPDEIIGRWYHDWTVFQSADKIIQNWKSQGYTHVLINKFGADFVHMYDPNSPPVEYWDGLQMTLDSLVPISINADGYQLYQLP